MTPELNMNASPTTLSIVVPAYNEAEVLPRFVTATLAVLRRMPVAGELILVNDGSRDDSRRVIRELCAACPEVRLVDLSRNFGKEYALSAGLRYASGQVVVVMDADLQHPPEVLPAFLERWQEGYDLVFGEHHSRREDSRLRRALSRVFYRLFNRMTEAPLRPNTGDFLLMDRCVVEALNALPERNRFNKGLFAWVGFRQTGVSYEQEERAGGQTRWNFWKLWNFALDGLTSFSTLPLRLWSYIGALVSLAALLYAVYLVLRTLIVGVDVPGFASLIVIMLFLGGVQLISLGVIGEYLGRLYLESKQRPLYLVRETCGFPADATPQREAVKTQERASA